jgi:formylglycine-generating enzyme required for sulfatase activity
MATIPLKIGYFKMDVLETSISQFNAWVSLNPSLVGARSECSGNTIGVHSCTNCQLPVSTVDWCDADAYCRSVGKRLCGQVNMDIDPNAYANSEFLVACTSSRGTEFEVPNKYTYGNTLISDVCVAQTYAPKAVGSKSGCHSNRAEYAAVFDLSGNVEEWVDEHAVNGWLMRGGHYQTQGECQTASPGPITSAGAWTGFRCCADSN